MGVAPPPKQVGIIRAFCTKEAKPTGAIPSARVIGCKREGDVYHLEINVRIDCVRCGALLSERRTWVTQRLVTGVGKEDDQPQEGERDY